MSHGGARPGSGRKPGSPNRKTAATIEAIAASGMTPLEYLIATMRDEANDPAMRLDAAKAAAPYCHPKLSSIEHSGPDGGPISYVVEAPAEALSTSEWAKRWQGRAVSLQSGD